MKLLANGCRYSGVKVTPQNWKSTTKVNKPWAVWYRFYDDRFKDQHPKGKLVRHSDFNSLKTADERRKEVRTLIELIERDLEVLDYNPVTGYLREPDPVPVEYGIDPNMPLKAALQLAHTKLDVAKTTKQVNLSVLGYVQTAIAELYMENMPIKDVRRRHAMAIMEHCGKIKKTSWTANTYNFYRAHLQMLFKIIVAWQAIEYNPIDDNFPIKKVVRRKRKTLTPEERTKIDLNLRATNYRFWRFIRIFFRSGARETEMVLVRKKHVDLKNQEVTYLILKGSEYREEVRPITIDVLPLWEQVMVEAKDALQNDFLFAKGLRPGKDSIRPEQFTRRWRRWVKKEYGIDADLYSLKHSNSTETKRKVGSRLAAMHNQHTEAVLNKNYDVGGEAFDMEILKSIENKFA